MQIQCQRAPGLAVRRHKFRRGQIRDRTFQPEADQLRLLDAAKAAVPVRKPLRRQQRKRGKNDAHQRD
jgi:hypothetical protein